ncbi:MAG: sulfatase-like hydrolase/transferase [bacterium]|nr:sulfatase-like hydrolase/transferase [bacterium]
MWAALGIAIVTLGALGVWALSSGPPTGEAGDFRNLLLVTFDTTRADHVGCYGYSKASTPNLDNMAQRGVTFERCITAAPITLPSHASILTGLYPFHHGARNNGTHFLPEEVPTLAEALSAAGFSTGAVVSALVLDSRYGLDQGFDAYDDNLANAERAPLFMFRETKALDTAQRAIRWLQDRADERWFLWVHFFDPHANYEPPEVYAARCPDSPYDGEIAYADAGLGEVLESLRTLGKLDETLVVMTSDHGEGLGEHGESTHSMFIYDATTRVPLIFMHPSLAQRKRVRGVVSSVDIVPTVLELLDVPAGGSFDGQSVARAMLVPDGRHAPRPAYSEAMSPYYNHGWSDLRGLRDEAGRFIRAPKPELYDLRRDGRELNNLFPKAPELAEPYDARLASLLPTTEADVRGDDIRSMDPEVRASLAALGYVWDSTEDGEDAVAASERLDPKDRVHLWEVAQRANQLVRDERFEEAEAALRATVAEDPGSLLSRTTLASVLMRLEKFDEALELVRETVLLPGARNSNWLRLAELGRKLELGDWREHVLKAKELDPRDPLPWVREGDWEQDDGDADAAIRAYQAALDLDGRCAKAWVGIGNTEHRRGNDDAAERALLKALEADPINVEALYNRGVVAESLGRGTEAAAFYAKALEHEPKHVLVLVNLANLYLKAKQLAQAEALYGKALAQTPDDFNANFNLGVLLLGSRRVEEAVLVLGRACASEPERIEGWRTLMTAARANGDRDLAFKAATRIAGIEPDNLPALMTAAAMGHALDRGDAARAALRRALNLDAARVEQRAQRDAELRAALEDLRAAGGD